MLGGRARVKGWVRRLLRRNLKGISLEICHISIAGILNSERLRGWLQRMHCRGLHRGRASHVLDLDLVGQWCLIDWHRVLKRVTRLFEQLGYNLVDARSEGFKLRQSALLLIWLDQMERSFKLGVFVCHRLGELGLALQKLGLLASHHLHEALV